MIQAYGKLWGRRDNVKKHSRSDKIFDMINMVLLTLMMAVILYPLYFIVIASISSPAAVNSGQVLLFPKGATLEGYKYVLKDNLIWKGYANTNYSYSNRHSG